MTANQNRMVKSYLTTKDQIILIAIAAFVMSTTVIALTYGMWWQVRGSHFLPMSSLGVTTGTIISSGEGDKSLKSAIIVYDIWFSYRVNGRTYKSDQVSFSYKGTNSDDYALGYIRKYPPGKVVKVYYDRSAPASSVLEPDVKADYTIQIVLFVLSCFYVFFAIVWSVFCYFRMLWRWRQA